jgi:hypothetical protein
VDFWANTEGSTLQRTAENTFSRNAAEREIYSTQRRLWAAAMRSTRGFPVTEARDKPTLITLPAGQKIHQARLSNGNIDVPEANQIYEKRVCAILGIPRSMMFNDSAVKADVVGTHAIFRRTILHWSGLLGRVLTEVHSRIPNMTASKRLKRSKKMSSEELYDIKESEGVTVSFPIGLFGTSREQLFELYQKKMIDYEQYSRYSLKLAGLPSEAMRHSLDPLNDTEKKRLYVPLVQQKEVIKLQAKEQVNGGGVLNISRSGATKASHAKATGPNDVERSTAGKVKTKSED